MANSVNYNFKFPETQHKEVKPSIVIQDDLDERLAALKRIKPSIVIQDDLDERLAALKRIKPPQKPSDVEMNLKHKRESSEKVYGRYLTFTTEKDYFISCKESKYVILHLYRTLAKFCAVLDKHLSVLANKHTETLFCKLDVAKAPLICHHLKLKVIPTIVLCKDNKPVGCITEFYKMERSILSFTDMLECQLAVFGVINSAPSMYSLPESEESSPESSSSK